MYYKFLLVVGGDWGKGGEEGRRGVEGILCFFLVGGVVVVVVSTILINVFIEQVRRFGGDRELYTPLLFLYIGN